MPHVVTQSCCSDASCVYACPVNCIQPTPDSPDFLKAEMLHVDPSTCVDCGACVAACPVSAIKPHTKLGDDEQAFAAINAAYFEHDGADAGRTRAPLAPVTPPLVVRRSPSPLSVAVVGSGPAGMYAADELMTIPGARVDIYERLSRPFGLVRHGVAPDHRRTRNVTRQFELILAQRGLRLHLGVEVGRDISHAELVDRHHAVIYAVGAASDRRLEIPGAELRGTASATEFVAWYNGHPDHVDRAFDLSGTTRAVVIGNGNVALDVARILTLDPERLLDTDINPRALSALHASRVEEVVIAARRGPEHSAFTLPELVGLSSTASVALTVDRGELPADSSRDDQKLALLRSLRAPRGGERRIVLRYGLAPARIAGTTSVEAVEFSRAATGATEAIEAGLVLSSIGYRGVTQRDLPFDSKTATIPNDRGRIAPGTYVAGWIKRGPSGFIGTNRSCAQETVRRLVEDHNAGLLIRPRGSSRSRGLRRHRRAREGRTVLAA